MFISLIVFIIIYNDNMSPNCNYIMCANCQSCLIENNKKDMSVWLCAYNIIPYQPPLLCFFPSYTT